MIDQVAEYRKLMGEEATERQTRAARLAAGMCTCETSQVRRRWADSGEVSTRTVHKEGCPKRKPWMERT